MYQPLQTTPESGDLLAVVEYSLNEFADGVVGALPDLVSGFVFLVVATVLIKVVMFVVRTVLKRALPGESPVYRQFIATIVLVFLVFGVTLSFLSIVGLTVIAASLGTATGFLALGVSYALSGMIADAVAGVYLLRDPDFMPGDTVDIGGTEGSVKAIELRKTRLDVDGDTVVRANAEIEKKWTKRGDDA
jgi:small-conductance mechanosensitive channel